MRWPQAGHCFALLSPRCQWQPVSIHLDCSMDPPPGLFCTLPLHTQRLLVTTMHTEETEAHSGTLPLSP